VTGLRIGSLFSGYGGLDMGVQAAVGGEVAWHVEFDDAPSRILAHHWPEVPNHGDITTTDFASVTPVDVLTGGFPCQDVSLAGRRRGMHEGTRSGLWSHFARAIDQLHPQLVVIENVRGLLSAEATGNVEPDPWTLGDGDPRSALRALGAVLGDLADLGYDAQWAGVRAADAGAPHSRFRVFVTAHPHGGGRLEGIAGVHAGEPDPRRSAPQDADRAARRERRLAAPGQAEGGRPRADARGRDRAPAADTHRDEPAREREQQPRGAAPARSRTDAPADTDGYGQRAVWRLESLGRDADRRDRQNSSRNTTEPTTQWGAYAAAVVRWEGITRPAPAPTRADGRDGAHRMSPLFVEWMMGLPAGHVTDPDIGITRAEQLKALGNGVVPQQAALGIRTTLAMGAAA
jgi:DNA (cytosine-5)-methyltransferase 1